MPTRIRLKRVGAKKQPHYRIVVMHSSKPRDGAAIEELGHYNPRAADPMPVFNDPDRALHWLLTGAQPSETARSLLRKAGIWARFAAIRDKGPRPAKADSASAEADETPDADEPPEADEAAEADESAETAETEE